MARSARPPWKRSNPRKRAGKASTHLTSKQKSAAKARAKRAGRRYPNLVDNMRMASKAKKATKKRTTKRAKTSARRSGAAKKTARKRSAKAREKDPEGGLTAAGRKAFPKKFVARVSEAIPGKGPA
jgi:hypothetical protein